MSSPTLARPKRRRLLRLAVGLVGVVAVLWLVTFIAVGGGIARGTTVAGVDIGGRSPTEARAILGRELRAPGRAPMRVQVGDLRSTVRPRQAGLSLDVEGTVAAAPARSWNPVRLVAALFGDNEVDPVVTVEREALTATVRQLADQADIEPREGEVSFAGDQVTVTMPRQGRRLRQPAAADRLRSAFLRERGIIRLPTTVRATKVTRAEVRRAARELAEPAVSGPVIVAVPGRRLTVPARTIGDSLRLEPTSTGTLRLVVDGARLHSALADELGRLDTPPRDATFRIVNGRPRVVPARQGEGVDPTALATAVLPAFTRTGPARTATVGLSVSEPTLSTAQAASLGVDELVADYTTYYPSDFAPRLTNIHRAADLMDDTLVLPGDVFSLNRTVGERTAARGFAAGYIINGGKLEVDFGGGVSQLATTTFNAAFFAGLEIVEHHPHSFYISRYPEGRESTVAWGVKDVRVRNDSGHGVFITTGYTDSSVTVRIWGTKRFRIEATKGPRYDARPYRTVYDSRPAGTTPGRCVASSGVPGFKVDVFRLFFRGGVQVEREKFHTVYAPENQIICGRSAPRSPSPSPTPTAAS